MRIRAVANAIASGPRCSIVKRTRRRDQNLAKSRLGLQSLTERDVAHRIPSDCIRAREPQTSHQIGDSANSLVYRRQPEAFGGAFPSLRQTILGPSGERESKAQWPQCSTYPSS